jgi:hypothetical protein
MKRMITHGEKMTLIIFTNVVKQSRSFENGKSNDAYNRNNVYDNVIKLHAGKQVPDKKAA